MTLEEEIQQSSFQNIFQKAYLNLVYTTGWLRLREAEKFRPFGVTLPQYNLLRILRGQHPEPASVNLLIERMLDKTSNASRIVDKLEAKNLVTRSPNRHDRRIVDIAITEKGLTLLAEMDEVANPKNSKIGNLSEAEAEQLTFLLDKIRD